jgi:hypothetical protein
MSEYKYKTMDSDGKCYIWTNKPYLRNRIWWRMRCEIGDRLGRVRKVNESTNHLDVEDYNIGFYSATGFDCVTGIPLVNDVVTFQGEPESDSDKQKRVQSLEYTETSSQLSCVDELFSLIGDKNVSVSFDYGGQDKTITIVDSEGKTYLATNVEELKEILSAIDTLIKYYYDQ